MFNEENKKTLEAIYDMLTEQSQLLQEIKSKLSEVTKPTTEIKKGIVGLAEILHCSKTTAAKWLKKDLVPYTRQGNIYLFEVDAVLDAIKKIRRKRQ
jgi:hypothetical protein